MQKAWMGVGVNREYSTGALFHLFPTLWLGEKWPQSLGSVTGVHSIADSSLQLGGRGVVAFITIRSWWWFFFFINMGWQEGNILQIKLKTVWKLQEFSISIFCQMEEARRSFSWWQICFELVSTSQALRRDSQGMHLINYQSEKSKFTVKAFWFSGFHRSQ